MPHPRFALRLAAPRDAYLLPDLSTQEPQTPLAGDVVDTLLNDERGHCRVPGVDHRHAVRPTGPKKAALAVTSALLRPTPYLWEDSEGVVHEILQGEGGEQGRLDARIVRSWSTRCVAGNFDRLRPEERLFAFLDDINIWSPSPNRMATLHTTIQEQLLVHTGIQIHHGKTQLWNRAGVA